MLKVLLGLKAEFQRFQWFQETMPETCACELVCGSRSTFSTVQGSRGCWFQIFCKFQKLARGQATVTDCKQCSLLETKLPTLNDFMDFNGLIFQV